MFIWELRGSPPKRAKEQNKTTDNRKSSSVTSHSSFLIQVHSQHHGMFPSQAIGSLPLGKADHATKAQLLLVAVGVEGKSYLEVSSSRSVDPL